MLFSVNFCQNINFLIIFNIICENRFYSSVVGGVHCLVGCVCCLVGVKHCLVGGVHCVVGGKHCVVGAT